MNSKNISCLKYSLLDFFFKRFQKSKYCIYGFVYCIFLCDERSGSLSLFSSGNSSSGLILCCLVLTAAEETLARLRKCSASAGPACCTSEAK